MCDDGGPIGNEIMNNPKTPVEIIAEQAEKARLKQQSKDDAAKALKDEAAALEQQAAEARASDGPKKPRFKLSPELSDGDHWTIVSKAQAMELVGMWLDYHKDAVGESCQIEIVAMTDAEVEALPDI